MAVNVAISGGRNEVRLRNSKSARRSAGVRLTVNFSIGMGI